MLIAWRDQYSCELIKIHRPWLITRSQKLADWHIRKVICSIFYRLFWMAIKRWGALKVTEQLTNIIGQNLISIGLYTVAFESMVLSFRAQTHGFIAKNEPSEIDKFLKKCKTASDTFDYCTPRMLELGVLSDSDVGALSSVRLRRNHYAHEGYNDMLSLTVRDVETDVTFMLSITKKVQSWGQEMRITNPDGSTPFSISPAIFGLYMHSARELARTKLAISGAP